jgi:hypothetical protein
MIKLLVKLAIVALVANALFRIGTEYLTFIKFRDDVRDAAMFKAKTEDELRQRIGALAEQYDLEVDPDSLSIDREARVWRIHGYYSRPIEIVPRYEYEWPFPWDVEAVVPDTERLPGVPNR